MSFEKFYQEYLQEDDPDYTVSLYDRLKWLYDKAHRHGWKQAKREAATIANDLFKYESGYYHYKDDVGDAISVMEYKEG